ncbi:uncharacterized protein LOC113564068 [Drosophila erecta]|uniref:uncharacterized protein LOC113564068 n=1 Tax=Drosophila erecta TaxID=7220 RepID=UPI0001782787|nr:uncharacterized protein LOC113564068 [Drosophila erecta]
MTPFSTRLSLLVAVLLVVALTTEACSTKVGKVRRRIRNSSHRSSNSRSSYNEPVPSPRPVPVFNPVQGIKPFANLFASTVLMPLVRKPAEAHKPTYRSQQNSTNAHHGGGALPAGDVDHPEAPQKSSSGLGLGTDLLAAAVGGAIQGLTSNSYFGGGHGSDDKITTTDVGSGTKVINAGGN